MCAIEPALAGVTKQRDMEGQGEPIGGASARVDQLQVFVGQDVIALQRDGIGGNAQQGVTDRRREKASGCHGVSPKGCFAFRDRLEYRDE